MGPTTSDSDALRVSSFGNIYIVYSVLTIIKALFLDEEAVESAGEDDDEDKDKDLGSECIILSCDSYIKASSDFIDFDEESLHSSPSRAALAFARDHTPVSNTFTARVDDLLARVTAPPVRKAIPAERDAEQLVSHEGLSTGLHEDWLLKRIHDMDRQRQVLWELRVQVCFYASFPI